MMSRGFNLLVIGFWVTTMSWLMWVKVLPPLLEGTPPSYQKILEQDSQDAHPVVEWDLLVDGEAAGHARTETLRIEDEVTQINNEIHFTDLPWSKLMPVRLSIADDPLREAEEQRLQVTLKNLVEIDPLGRLAGFDSSLSYGDVQDAVRVLGTVQEDELNLTISAGSFKFSTKMFISPDAMVGDSLSPLTRLPELKLGQRWSEPVYSALRPSSRPLEILYAKVEREDMIIHAGRSITTLLVVYRGEASGGIGQEGKVRGRTWVRKDGLVLQQEVLLGDSWLRFVRRPVETTHTKS
jgi:hypothetical protein